MSLSRRRLMANSLATGTTIIGLEACAADAQNEAAKAGMAVSETTASTALAAAFEQAFDANVARHPEQATSLGDKRGYDKWDIESEAFAAQGLALQVAANAGIQRLGRIGTLHAQDTLSVRLVEKIQSALK